jgi:hypothetical protein
MKPLQTRLHQLKMKLLPQELLPFGQERKCWIRENLLVFNSKHKSRVLLPFKLPEISGVSNVLIRLRKTSLIITKLISLIDRFGHFAAYHYANPQSATLRA